MNQLDVVKVEIALKVLSLEKTSEANKESANQTLAQYFKEWNTPLTLLDK